MEADQPQQAHDRARPEGPGRPRAACCGWSTTPTCSSRTSGPARSNGSASARTSCSPATRGSSSRGSSGSARTGRTPSGPGSPPSPRRCPGFAAINGEPDGQPLLPPIALTDEATGLAAAFATMVALHSGQRPGRRRQPAGDDVPAAWARCRRCTRCTGEQQPRLGAGLPYTVPRGTYRCADGRWIAVSTSSDTVAARVHGAARRRRRRALRARSPGGPPTATSWRP